MSFILLPVISRNFLIGNIVICFLQEHLPLVDLAAARMLIDGQSGGVNGTQNLDHTSFHS